MFVWGARCPFLNIWDKLSDHVGLGKTKSRVRVGDMAVEDLLNKRTYLICGNNFLFNIH